MSNSHLDRCEKDLRRFEGKILKKIEVSWNTMSFLFEDGSTLDIEADGPPGVDLLYKGSVTVNISGDLSQTQNDE